MLMMLGGLGLESPGQQQLMLMMLWRLGLKRALKAGPAPGDAHEVRGFGLETGPAPADAHDARGLGVESADVHDAQGFGLESPGQHQLMLMMLGGLGFESAGQHWVLKARASTSCGFESPGPAPADVHDARRFGF